MIGFESINRYKGLFFIILWLSLATSCIGTPAVSPPEKSTQKTPQTSSENPPQAASENPPQAPSESPPQAASESPPQTPAEISSQNTPESLSQKTSESASQKTPERFSQKPPQTPSENPSEISSQNMLKELESRLELARKDLRISEATEARIASGLEQLKNSGIAPPETMEDYEIYLSRAREMVVENRKIVQELETLYAKYATLKVSSSPSASTDVRKVPNPKLPDEKEFDELGKLDREFDDSLSVFDELLLMEMDEIRTKSATKMRDLAAEAAAAAQRLQEKGVDVDPSSPEASSGVREGAPESEQSESSAEKRAGETQTEAAGTRQEGSKGEAGGQASGQQQQGRPSGYDDDIVARQIREAAENETDPELKEKLWKEYEDYKKGSRQ